MRNLRLNHWILVSQLTLLVLVGALAWQGISAARTQDRMVRTLLSDYAQLIVENAERTFNAALGFRTFYKLVQGLQSQPDLFPLDREWQASAFTESTSLAVNADEILAVAVRDEMTGGLRMLWRHENTVSKGNFRELLDKLDPPSPGQPQFRVWHPEHDGVTQTLVIAAVPGTAGQAVVWLESSVIADRVSVEMESATLLPAALGDPERLRPNINLSLSDTFGRKIFSTAHPPGTQLSRSRVISGDYSGLMAGFTVQASINPAIAGELVIGGLPYGRLPFIIGLVIVALGLGALAYFLMRRQREVQRLRDDFIARVSHELRTPLTQIRMYAESLLHQRIHEPAARKDALAVINRETLRLGNMVDSILRFEDPQSRAPLREHIPYSLAKWGNDLGNEYQPLLDVENASLHISIPDHVVTTHNRDALAQIAGNLLDNALKYGPAGEEIEVSYHAASGGWQLVFRDQGPGIPAGWNERVFEPYQRLDRDRENGSTGTGIGLSVARDIALSMGGTLAYEDGSSGGQFVLTLPENTDSADGTGNG